LTVNLHQAQADFLRSKALFKAFCGGIGSGKSWCVAYDCIRRAKAGRLFLVVAPTFSMLSDATFRSFLSVARMLGVISDRDIKRGAPPSMKLLTGAELLFRSADEPDHLRGPNISGCVLDEASLMDKEVFDICIGRLRENGEQGWLTAAFTPKGKKHWTYQVFGLGQPDTALIRSTTRDNPFLPESFASTVAAQYTTRQAAQELGGEFIDTEGSLFRREWFHVVETPPHCRHLVRWWDLAATAPAPGKNPDHSAGVLMGRTEQGQYVILDVRRVRATPKQVELLIRQTAELDGIPVPIWMEQEPGSSGVAVIYHYRDVLAGFIFHAERSTGDKATRAAPLAAMAEGGNVLVVNRPWTRDLLDELECFPAGGHDDMVDAASGAFGKLARGRSYFGDRQLVLSPEVRDANGKPLEIGRHGRPPGTGVEWHFSQEASDLELRRINAEMEAQEDREDAWGHDLIR
jgi:predicted phage terminase large subunit-like protein